MRVSIKWGIILAAALALWTLAIHALGIYTSRVQYAEIVDQVVVIVPLVVLTLALLEYRRDRSGSLPIWRGAAIGLGVAAFSAPMTVGFMWMYHHYVNPNWLSILVAHKRQEMSASGAAPDAIATAIAQLQQSGTDRNQIVGGLVGTVVMGLVLSVAISLVLALWHWATGASRKRGVA
jgi:hypothetical protein